MLVFASKYWVEKMEREKRRGGGPKIKTIVMRKTESVSDGGIKWGVTWADGDTI